MEQPATEPAGPWYLRKSFRKVALIAIVVTTAIEGYYAVFRRENDFNCHIAFGEHFLAGDPYASVGNYYPLGRVMLDSLLAVGDYHVTRGIVYGLAIASLFAIFHLWHRIASVQKPIAKNFRFPATALTLGVIFPFVLRDLDECGLQIFLLLMLSLGAFAYQRKELSLSGFWLAAAATYKATPLLFLPLLLWKREWKVAGSMVLFLVALNLFPAVYLGWETTVRSHQYWFTHAVTIMKDTPEAHPSVPNIEPPKHQNVSLTAALARLVESYPPGHPLHLDHPLFFQFGRLPVETAKPVVKGLILLLGLVIAWRMRRKWGKKWHQADLAPEWAVACIFSALLSPLCWKQHLVLVLPGLFLIIRSMISEQRKPRWRVTLFAGIAGIFLLTRPFLIGHELSILLLSYNFITFSVLAVTFLVLTLPESGDRGISESEVTQQDSKPQSFHQAA